MNVEPVSEAQLAAIRRMIIRANGPLALFVTSIDEADLTKGRGVLEGDDRCLWTKDGRRITIALPRDGGLVVSCSKEPDPECPKT